MTVEQTNKIERMEELLSQEPALAMPGIDAPPTADPVEDKLPEFDVGWAAGLFDGEGCIHLARQRKSPGKPWTHHLRACMTQNDLPVLQHFQRGMGVGGRIYAVARKPWHSRQVYTLNFATAQSIALLQRLGPHLVRKRVELALARRFWTECAPGACPGPRGLPPEVCALREWLYVEMKRAKRSDGDPMASTRAANTDLSCKVPDLRPHAPSQLCVWPVCDLFEPDEPEADPPVREAVAQAATGSSRGLNREA